MRRYGLTRVRRIAALLIAVMTVFVTLPQSVSGATNAEDDSPQNLDFILILDTRPSSSLQSSAAYLAMTETAALLIHLFLSQNSLIALVPLSSSNASGSKINRWLNADAAEYDKQLDAILRDRSEVEQDAASRALTKTIALVEENARNYPERQCVVMYLCANAPAAPSTGDASAVLRNPALKSGDMLTANAVEHGVFLSARAAFQKSSTRFYSVEIGAQKSEPTEWSALCAATGGERITPESDLCLMRTAELYSKTCGASFLELSGSGVDAGDGALHMTLPLSYVSNAFILIAAQKPLQSLSLSDPSASDANFKSGASNLTQTDRFSLVRLIEPESGAWSLTANGGFNNRPSVYMILQYNERLRLSLSPDAESIRVGDTISAEAFFSNATSEINALQKSGGVNVVLRYQSADQNASAAMTYNPKTLRYEGKLPIQSHGVYEIWCESAIGQRTIQSAHMHMDVANHAPAVSAAAGKELMQDTVNIAFYAFKPAAVVSLFRGVKAAPYALGTLQDWFLDKDGETLVITCASENAKIATLDKSQDGNFAINAHALGKTSVTITATDPYGATAQKTIFVNVTDSSIAAFSWVFWICAACLVVLAALLAYVTLKKTRFIRNSQ